MKKVGENKGITMIVLVVTIAIMLILAGVTISTVFGDEGLIKQSKELAKQTESSIEDDNNDVNSLINEWQEKTKAEASKPITIKTKDDSVKNLNQDSGINTRDSSSIER